MGLFNLFFSLCNHTLTTLITSGAKMISLLRGIAPFASFIRRITLLVRFFYFFLWDVSIIWENSEVRDWEGFRECLLGSMRECRRGDGLKIFLSLFSPSFLVPLFSLSLIPIKLSSIHITLTWSSLQL